MRMPLSAEFQVGSAAHFTAAGVSVIAILGAIGLGLRWRNAAPEREYWLRVAWVLTLVPFQVFSQAWDLRPEMFQVRGSMPLHICDFVVWTIPFALIARHRWAQTMLFFWGIALSPWAMIVPNMTHGPATLKFYLFFTGHVQILGSALYVLIVMGYVPRRRDLGFALVVNTIYAIVITPVNILLHTDYGSIGPDPSATGIVGPWPLRILLLWIIAAVAFAMMTAGVRALASPRTAE